jgi:FkbM family methyltransferase
MMDLGVSVKNVAGLAGAVVRRPVVYDVGMNNGDDAAYYLRKGFDVVGIDAHSGLCERCTARFATEIAQGRMRVINVGVGAEEGTLDFYQNELEDPISTFQPAYWTDRSWQRPVPVAIRKLSSIIREHGEPYFVKIDVEFLDHLVLIDLLRAGILPRYISAEAQLIDVYCVLVSMGYESFKLVEGKSIPQTFRGRALSALDGSDFRHEFSPVSSGPFGEDLPGEWLDKNEVLRRLLDMGLGWVDLHARRDE